MKEHLLHSVKKLCGLIVGLVIAFNSQAVQLSGSYTINPAGAATATNFKDFKSAINYLTSATARPDAGPANVAPFGVSGPVMFTVSAGTYIGQVIVPAITGTSATNTVTFDGINAATRIVSDSGNRAAFIVNQASYITVKNLTVNNTYVGVASGIALVGNTGNNAGVGFTVKGCIVNLPNVGTNTSYGIVVTGNAAGTGDANQYTDSATIDSNTINGGYYGIQISTSGNANASYNRGHRITRNLINNVYYYGIRTYYVYNSIVISNNNITMNPVNVSSYGIYFYYCQNSSTTTSSIVSGNKVVAGYTALYNYYTSTAGGAPTLVYNNMLKTNGSCYATLNQSAAAGATVKILHNTVYANGPSGSYGGLYLTTMTAAGTEVKNNIFIVDGAAMYPVYIGSAVSGNFLNYNSYYNKQGGILGFRGGVNFPASFKTVTAGGDSSFNLNLGLDATLASIDACIPQGVDLTAIVPTDIDGDLRATTPRIGADEYNGVNNDLSIDKIISPLAPVTLGLQDLAIRVKNTGNTVITSFDLNYKNNALAVKTQPWSGTLNPCDTVTLTFTSADQINLVASNAVSIYTSLPNGIADGKRSNDTLKTNYLTPLNGTYTIGATGIYPTFTSAITALTVAGVTGPVTFNVQAGTYTGQILIAGIIPGLSATNTVTFDGIDATTRFITDSANRAAVIVNQVSYITFKNFTVTNKFAGTASGIALVGNLVNNAGVGFTVKKCVVNLPNVGTGTSYGIIVTGNVNGTGDANQYTDSVTIDSNTINGGYYGIQISTAAATANSNFNRGHRITGNTVNNAYYYGIRVYYIYNAVTIMNNKITMSPVNAASSYGIYFYQCPNPSTTVSSIVSGNRIVAGYVALYHYYTSTAGGAPSLVYNNILRTNGTCYATMYEAAAAGATVKIFHNTLYGNGPTGTYGGLYFTTMTAAGTEVKNNIFIVDGAGMYPVYFGSAVPGNFLNYNSYYNKQGGILGFRGGVNFPASFKTVTAGGDSSFNLNLSLDAALASIDACIPQGVDVMATVPIDIDGDVRATTPRIGADENNGAANDLSVEKVIAPVAPVTAGLQDVVVRVKNSGNTMVTGFTLSYKNNASPVRTQSWSGTLNPCDTVTLTFTGADQINLVASNNVSIYTSLPNGIADGKGSNDTLKTTFLSPLNGTYTIGATGNYPTFADATTALAIAGVTGPVVFTVQPGTYSEQVIVNGPVAGISSTNTVTFDGVNAATRIVNDSANRAAFIVNQVSYVTVKNLTVTNKYRGVATGIALVGNLINNAGVGFTVKKCVVNLPNIPIATTSYGIIITGNVNGTADVNQWTDSVTIDSNTINGGYYGINISTGGTGNANYNRDHKVRYNTINNAYYYGIRINYIFNPIEINYNTVNMSPDNVNNYGIYLWYNQCGAAPISSKIIGNKIYAGYAGLYEYYGGNTAPLYPKAYYNNMINVFGASAYGLYISTSATGGAIYQIYHNTVNTLNISAAYGLYYYNSTGSTSASMFKNNIFQVVGSGTYPAYFSTNPVGNVVNYNSYFNAGGNRLGFRGSDFTTANYKSATFGGDSSFNQNAYFVSNTDLHSYNACAKGVDLTAFVPTDIDGDVRSLSPIVGADEQSGLANDVSVDKLYIQAPVRPGAQDLSVRIKNSSPNVLSSANIKYSLNGAAPVTIAWSGTLLGCGDTAYVTFTGAQQLNLVSGTNSLKVYTADPNATIDNNRSNDTAVAALSTITKVNGNALSGNGTGGIGAGSSIRFDSKPEMIGTTAMTASAWIKLNVNNIDQKIVSKTIIGNGFCFGLNGAGRLDPEIWTVAGGATSVRMTSTGVSLPNNLVPANEWVHVAFTWQSGVGVKAYVNGSLAGYLNSTTATTLTPSTTDLFIGSNSWDGGFALNGMVDEVSLWNIALDSMMIRRAMHSTLTGLETGLVSYIQLNEPVSSTNFSDVMTGATGYRGAAAVMLASTAPLGGDSTMTLGGTTGGTFYNGSLSLNVYDAFDNACDLTITEVPYSPNTLPTATNVYTPKYWIIQPFGNPGVFASDLTLSFPVGHLNTTDPALRLYRRDYNSDGAWTVFRNSTSITPFSVTFSGVDTLGQFTVASNGTSALPVSLLTFGAKAVNDVVNVNWSTANEVNSEYFEVERTYDMSEDFRAIGTVKAAGNTSKVLNYAFVDQSANMSKTIYYRLRQVDNDGKYSYSPIAVVEPTVGGNDKVEVYPNPFNTGVEVSFVAATAEAKATIKVVNIAGKTVHTESVTTVSGRNNKVIDLADLQSGVYFISIELNGVITNLKLVKN